MKAQNIQPDQASVPQPSCVLQRKCASCGNHTVAGGKCHECESKEALLRRTMNGYSEASGVPPIVHDVLNSAGQPLGAQTRAFFEPRFDHDFSQVRVHIDAKAAESARAVSALAYTVGRDVVFGAGQYAPQSSEGQRLIAHELTHVIQQASAPWTGGALRLGASDTAQEREADHASREEIISSPQPALTTVRAAAGVIERQLAPSDGSLNLRLGNDGRIEFLIGTPDLPVTGRLGVGFRCQNGRCQPVGAKDPADISERTYTLQEAIDMLKKPREAPGAPSEPTPLAPICSPDRQIPLFNACCPPGLVWNGSACAPLSPCLPGQMSPGGICCPPGQQWDFITHRCDLAHPSEQASAPSSQFTLPQLQLGATPLRFGMIESATFDNFRVDDATAPSQHDAALDNLVSLLNIYREVEVHIEGHTDSSASEAHNDRLSVARAEGIRAALAARQVANPGRFRIQGFGERQLRFQPERTEADKAGNRRVEVWFHIPPSRGLGEELRLRPTL